MELKHFNVWNQTKRPIGIEAGLQKIKDKDPRRPILDETANPEHTEDSFDCALYNYDQS
jgi:hypothetical protein